MLNEPLWIWLTLGFMPYQIKRDNDRFWGRTLEVRALFWYLELHHRPGCSQRWTLCVPLITHLRDAIWSALTRLRNE
jgi:hypothetical protein